MKAHTARKRDTGFVAAFNAAPGGDTHPHFEPINAAAFMREHGVAVSKAQDLLGYQNYLAAARTAKMKRKRTTMAFERGVLLQAQKASGDLDVFTGAALRMTQQVNQTEFWSDTLTRMNTTLRRSGRKSVRSMWTEITDGAERRSALAEHGLTPDLLAAVSDALTKAEIDLVPRDGTVAIEAREAGRRGPLRRLSLRGVPKRPKTLSDLLRRSQFDQAFSAIINKQPIYLEAVPTPGVAEYEPADLFAVGAVAVRARMAEHVRKLEDTGLATHQGNDPVTFVVSVFVAAAILGLIGWGILETCALSGARDGVCAVGALLVMIAMGMMGSLVAIFLLEGVAVAAIGFIGVQLLLSVILHYEVHYDLFFPDFNPRGVPPPS